MSAQAEILAVGQSAFFVTLVVCQLGNLLSTRRRRMPYFYKPKAPPLALQLQLEEVEVHANADEHTMAHDEGAASNSLPGILRICGCALASTIIAVLSTEVSSIASSIQVRDHVRFWANCVSFFFLFVLSAVGSGGRAASTCSRDLVLRSVLPPLSTDGPRPWQALGRCHVHRRRYLRDQRGAEVDHDLLAGRVPGAHRVVVFSSVFMVLG